MEQVTAGPRRGPRGTFGVGGAGALGVFVLTIVLAGCLDSDITTPPPPPGIDEVEFAAELGIDLAQFDEWPSGLWVRDEELGDEDGAEVEVDTFVRVDYVLWFPDGSEQDSSADRGPLEFVPASGDLIFGFSEGVLGMREGGTRFLLVPPQLAYGGQQWLVFRIELLDILDTP